MRIISKKRLRDFVKKHPGAEEPLRHWSEVVEESVWEHPAHLRQTLGSADWVGDLTVFNIGGNRYRLIAFVHYRKQICYIKHVLTHAEYDKESWKQ